MTTKFAVLVHPQMAGFLDSVAQMLFEGLKEVAIEPALWHSVPSGYEGGVIVLGANLFNPAELANLRSDAIIFNVENSASVFMTDAYLRLLRKFVVWDFSESNAAYISELLVRPIHYLKMFYVDGLSRIAPAEEPDIDVLFYGSFNERRSRVIEALRGRGLRVEAVFRVFGSDLDGLIARSKVILNVHFYESGRLELIRIGYLLANARAVVSELNEGELLDADLADAFVTVPYADLADAAETLVHDPERRANLAKAGFEAFRRRRASRILVDALNWSAVPRIPAEAQIGSGKAFDPRLLNIDADARWRPDVVADIADPALFEREFPTPRFGLVRLRRGWFDSITASHVLEHIPDLTMAMRNCLDMLGDGGVLHAAVPYDLSYGAWQDPTHVRAFNERSWLYYCEWHWYLGWMEWRFDVVEQSFRFSPYGSALAERGVAQDDILRTPRAVDAMHITLRKRRLTDAEHAHGQAMRGENRS